MPVSSSSLQLNTTIAFALTAAAAMATAAAFSSSSKQTNNIPKQLLQSPYAAELQLAVQMALAAGKNMYRYCDQAGTDAADGDLGIETKGKPEDFCTKIDLENERNIMAAIRNKFPSHEIIGEETVGQGKIPPLSKDTPTWIIDPVDGTTNFASGFPLTCVSIGLCIKGRPTVGVVYAPMTHELYMAVAGYGAYRNAVRLVKQSQEPKPLLESLVSYEFGYVRDAASIQIMVEKVQKILEHGCRGTRSIGSGVLNLCYVATGRLDVVYSGVAGESWKPWDYCAGHVIVTEAGCVMESIDAQNEEFDLYGKSIICATSSELAEEVRTIVA